MNIDTKKKKNLQQNINKPIHNTIKRFPDSSVGKTPAMQETPVQVLGREDPLEKG